MRIDETGNRPLEIRLETGNGADGGYEIVEGPMRGLFSQSFEPDAVYYFMRTSANPAAVEELRRPEHKEAYARFRGLEGQGDFCVEFDRKVMRCYLGALHHFAQTNLRWYASYPLLNAGNLAGKEFHQDEVLMPVVHVVKGELGARRLRNFIGRLHDDDVWAHLLGGQGERGFQLYELTLLREKNILPLVADNREMRIEGRRLRDVIDFIEQLEYKGKENC